MQNLKKSYLPRETPRYNNNNRYLDKHLNLLFKIPIPVCSVCYVFFYDISS